MDTHRLSRGEAEILRAEWQAALRELIEQAEAWAKNAGWEVERSQKEITEELLGTYLTEELEITTPHGRAILEPVARMVMGAVGRVDLYAWPTLVRVLLLKGKSGDWVIRTEFGPKWPQRWGEETFVALVRNLLDES